MISFEYSDTGVEGDDGFELFKMLDGPKAPPATIAQSKMD